MPKSRGADDLIAASNRRDATTALRPGDEYDTHRV
jgi:hypothetical protein